MTASFGASTCSILYYYRNSLAVQSSSPSICTSFLKDSAQGSAKTESKYINPSSVPGPLVSHHRPHSAFGRWNILLRRDLDLQRWACSRRDRSQLRALLPGWTAQTFACTHSLWCVISRETASICQLLLNYCLIQLKGKTCNFIKPEDYILTKKEKKTAILNEHRQ